jgi:tRNA-(ms[2]io[6]A)-hydroxylase
VLRLQGVTPAAWAEQLARDQLALLSDHAHCELKAAASAMTMLKQNPARPGLALRLAPLIKEESEHLHRVLRALDARGAGLADDRPNPYVAGLQRFARESRPAPPRGSGFLDTLLVSALIELRSHERFERLAECAQLAELHALYRGLGEAEARHGALFSDLAFESFPADVVLERFGQLAAEEFALLERLEAGPRVHSGHGGLVRASRD